jgi:hypothetical protein
VAVEAILAGRVPSDREVPMTERAPVDVTNLDRYGDPELPWSRPRDLLEAGPPGRRSPSSYSTLRTAFGVASAEPHGATRWRFAAPPGA